MKAVIAIFLIALVVAHPPRLVEVAKEVNRMKTTWIANERIPTRDYTQYLGALEHPTLKLEVRENKIRRNYPESFDAATNWPNCPLIAEIRDQSTCGSCWAFGAASSATDRLCIATNGEDKRRLSSEDLLTCCTKCGLGCRGGLPNYAWEWIKNTGISTGGEYGSTEWCNAYAFPKCEHHTTGKYPPCGETQPTPDCVKECQEGYPIPYEEDRVKFEDAYSVKGTVENIKEELMTKGPFEVAFTVYEDFMTYKEGIYQHVTGSRLGGHAVRIVGWGVEDGIEYWKIANSWNEDWGEDGYFRIIAGKDECGIETRGTAGTYKL